jgi:NAD(P)-dependent dehydrogenase (short-subunit alcohol dehydrogenase family)
MDLELTGKRVLVTGASRGIGRAIAHAFVREGAQVVLVSRAREDLERVRDDFLGRYPGSSVDVVAADLRESAVAAEIGRAVPDADVLVNNAGAIPHGSLLDLADDAWVEGWQLKVFGYIRLTREFYRRMKERGGGVVVNVIGFAGERFLPSYVAGSTGNAALIAFTKTVGAVSPADGIRVVGVNPGPTLTERLKTRMLQRAYAELGDPERWPELTRDFPFGRPGQPEEIADTVAFLASPRAGYITGSIVDVEGGMANRPIAT